MLDIRVSLSMKTDEMAISWTSSNHLPIILHGIHSRSKVVPFKKYVFADESFKEAGLGVTMPGAQFVPQTSFALQAYFSASDNFLSRFI